LFRILDIHAIIIHLFGLRLRDAIDSSKIRSSFRLSVQALAG